MRFNLRNLKNEQFIVIGVLLLAAAIFLIPQLGFSLSSDSRWQGSCDFGGSSMRVEVYNANEFGGRTGLQGTYSVNTQGNRYNSLSCATTYCVFRVIQGSPGYAQCPYFDNSWNLHPPLGSIESTATPRPTATSYPTATATTPPFEDCRTRGCPSGQSCVVSGENVAFCQSSLPTPTASTTPQPGDEETGKLCKTALGGEYVSDTSKCPYSVAEGVDDWVVAVFVLLFMGGGAYILAMRR